MEKNIEMTAYSNTTTVLESIINVIRSPFNFLRMYYSGIIGKKISFKQTWLITETQIAFIFAVFPVEASFTLRVLAVVWFLTSLIRTKASL